jgi:hypothetical protein
MSRPSPYPAELRQRAVRMVAEVRPNYESDWAAITAALFDHAHRHRAVYQALCGRQGGNLVYRHLRRLVGDLLREHLQPHLIAAGSDLPVDVVAEFYTSAALGLLTRWVDHDFRPGPTSSPVCSSGRPRPACSPHSATATAWHSLTRARPFLPDEPAPRRHPGQRPHPRRHPRQRRPNPGRNLGGGCRVSGWLLRPCASARRGVPDEGTTMKYMIMMFGGLGASLADRSPEWIKDMQSVMMRMDGELRAAGEVVDSQHLMDPSQATTIRFQNGAPTPTDGPFAEIKESLAGYWIIEGSHDRAVEIASQVVAVTEYPMEIRQIMDQSAQE